MADRTKLEELEDVIKTDRDQEIESSDSGDLKFEGGELDGQSMKLSDFEKKAAEKTEVVLPAETAADGKEIELPDPAAEPLPEDKTKEALAEGETAPDAKAADDKAEKPAGTEEAYKPNFGYKVYDQEKTFPEWAQKASTSKEAEEQVRATLQKSEAFEALKPKHETVVRERDENKRYVQDHVQKVERLVKLREKNLDGFFKEMGVSEDAVIKYAFAVVKAKDDPAFATQLANQRVEADQSFQREEAEASQARQGADAFAVSHAASTRLVMAVPEVQQFREAMDAKMGPGAFEREFAQTGSEAFNKGEGYVPPDEVVRRVHAKYSAVIPAAPAPAPAPTIVPAAAAAPIPVKPHERPKTLPNLGRGTSSSPTKAPMKNLGDMKARIDAELKSM